MLKVELVSPSLSALADELGQVRKSGLLITFNDSASLGQSARALAGRDWGLHVWEESCADKAAQRGDLGLESAEYMEKPWI